MMCTYMYTRSTERVGVEKRHRQRFQQSAQKREHRDNDMIEKQNPHEPIHPFPFIQADFLDFTPTTTAEQDPNSRSTATGTYLIML